MKKKLQYKKTPNIKKNSNIKKLSDIKKIIQYKKIVQYKIVEIDIKENPANKPQREKISSRKNWSPIPEASCPPPSFIVAHLKKSIRSLDRQSRSPSVPGALDLESFKSA